MGAQLLEVESSKTIDDYRDFKSDEAIQELLPKVDYNKPVEELALLLVQLTSFSGGGLCIGIALSHSMADGFAAIHFINTWPKLARGRTLEQHDMPFLDLTVLRCRQTLMPPRFHRPKFKPFPLILGASEVAAEHKKETTVQLLKLTAKQVNKTKNQPNQGAEIARPMSEFEAVSAHIWRRVSKARQNEYHQPSTGWLAGDIPSRLNPPLPPNYFGNAVRPTVTRNVTSGEVISEPLSYTTRKIREAVGLLREDGYLRSQLDLIENKEQVDSLRVVFNQGGCMKRVSWESKYENCERDKFDILLCRFWMGKV